MGHGAPESPKTLSPTVTKRVTRVPYLGTKAQEPYAYTPQKVLANTDF